MSQDGKAQADTTDERQIILDITEGIATITFNRPRARNSLDVKALSQFFEALGTAKTATMSGPPPHRRGRRVLRWR